MRVYILDTAPHIHDKEGHVDNRTGDRPREMEGVQVHDKHTQVLPSVAISTREVATREQKKDPTRKKNPISTSDFLIRRT